MDIVGKDVPGGRTMSIKAGGRSSLGVQRRARLPALWKQNQEGERGEDVTPEESGPRLSLLQDRWEDLGRSDTI